MLTYDILVDKNKNRALAGALAYSIFSKMLTDVFGGRNTVIHAIKVVQLLDERKFATGEKKKEIDDFLVKIVEEELNAIKRRMMNIKAIVPVLTLNEYYIKTYDISDKVYPEIVVKTFEKINPLKTIGKEKLEKLKYLNMIGNYNAFAYSFGLITQFHKSYFLEIEEIPRDAQRKFKFFQEFFEKLIDLEENIDLGKFYTSRVFNADRHIFLYILKYLYEPLMPVLSILEPLFDQNRDKFSVQSMVFYLSGIKQKQSKMELKQLQEEIRNCIAEGFSEDSDKMRRLKKMIDKQTSSIKFFRIMDDLLNESEKAIKILGPRIDFCREIFHFLDIAKTIHPSITATITQYLENLTDFEKEIDEVIVKVTDIKKKELISPAQFHEININASATKNRLIELASKDLFKNHTKELIKVSTKDVFGDQDIFKEAPESEPELAEEYNPLEELFNKYREELTIVASTSTLENFQEAFTFWMKEDVLPLTLIKAEELLLKNIFKKIRKKLDVIFQEIKDQKTIIEASEAAESTAEVEDQPLAEISDKIPTDEEVGQQPLVEVSEGVTPDKKVKEQQVIAEKSDEAPIDTEVEEQQVIAKKSEVAPPVMEVELSQPLIEKSDEAPIDTEVEEQQVIAKKSEVAPPVMEVELSQPLIEKSDEAPIDTEVEEQQVIAKKSDEAQIDTEVEEQQVIAKKSDEAPIDTEVEEQQVVAKKSDETPIDKEGEEQQVIAEKSEVAIPDKEGVEQQVIAATSGETTPVREVGGQEEKDKVRILIEKKTESKKQPVAKDLVELKHVEVKKQEVSQETRELAQTLKERYSEQDQSDILSNDEITILETFMGKRLFLERIAIIVNQSRIPLGIPGFKKADLVKILNDLISKRYIRSELVGGKNVYILTERGKERVQ
ncbi:MAG TPA: hypothetical protein ENI29_06725 [bacterium]|nr:hypothetical protein [bacterium]